MRQHVRPSQPRGRIGMAVIAFMAAALWLRSTAAQSWQPTPTTTPLVPSPSPPFP